MHFNRAWILGLALILCSGCSSDQDDPGDAGFDSDPDADDGGNDGGDVGPISSKMDLWTGDTPLLRGANLINEREWDEKDRVLHDGTLGSEYTLNDLQNLANEGANYANLSYPGLFHESPPYELDDVMQSNYDDLLSRLEQADLFAVISFRTGPGRSCHTFYRDEVGDFPADQLNESLWTNEDAQVAWIEMWRHTAERYRDNPIVVGYDLMVEPNSNEIADDDYPNHDFWEAEEFRNILGGTTWDWNQLYPRIVAAIREVDAETPILIAGNAYSAVWWLEDLDILEAPNVVYVAHQYEPFDYTHQGPSEGITESQAKWTSLSDVFDAVDDFLGSQSELNLAVNEYGVNRFAPGAADFLDRELQGFESRGINHAIWAWAPQDHFFGSPDFHLYYGPNPSSSSVVDPNDLLTAVRNNWSRNVVRPSNVNF